MKTFKLPFYEEFVTNITGDPMPSSAQQQKQYLDSDIIDNINKVAERGGEVIIDDENKTIYIKRATGTEYTLSGIDYDELITDVPHGVEPKNYLLWLSQKW